MPYDSLIGLCQPILNLLHIWVVLQCGQTLPHFIHQLAIYNKFVNLVVRDTLAWVIWQVVSHHVEVEVVHWLQQICWECELALQYQTLQVLVHLHCEVFDLWLVMAAVSGHLNFIVMQAVED